MQTEQTTRLTRREVIACGVSGLAFMAAGQPVAAQSVQAVTPWAKQLIEAARSQIGVTIEYDGAYEALVFPGGDIPRARGVCTDVIIRAYRDAFAFDLQAKVNADMKRNFRHYPKRWGLKRPDRNIDHRRVPNLQTYFKRRNAAVPPPVLSANFRPGDMISQMIGGRMPHIGIVSDRIGPSGRLLFIHNIGAGTREEDVTASFPVTGHYRFNPA